MIRITNIVKGLFKVLGRMFGRLPLLFKDVYLLEVKGIGDHYSDPREVILYAVMSQIVEMKTDPWYSHVDWTFTPEHLKTYHTVEKAYNYWTQRRPNRYSPLHTYNRPIPPLDGKCTDEEQYEWDWACELDNIYERIYEKEDQQMLRDVIEERLNLWCDGI